MPSNAGRDISINIEIPCDTGSSKGCPDLWGPESLPREAQEKRAAAVGAGAAKLGEALAALRPLRDGDLAGPSELELLERLESWHGGLRAEIERRQKPAK